MKSSPVFDGLYDFCSIYTGASLQAAVKLNNQVSIHVHVFHMSVAAACYLHTRISYVCQVSIHVFHMSVAAAYTYFICLALLHTRISYVWRCCMLSAYTYFICLALLHAICIHARARALGEALGEREGIAFVFVFVSASLAVSVFARRAIREKQTCQVPFCSIPCSLCGAARNARQLKCESGMVHSTRQWLQLLPI